MDSSGPLDFGQLTMASSSTWRHAWMLDSMTDWNVHEIDTILDRHDEAFRAFREASDAFDAAVVALRDRLNAIHAADHAQGSAIDALRTANQAALHLLRGGNFEHHV